MSCAKTFFFPSLIILCTNHPVLIYKNHKKQQHKPNHAIYEIFSKNHAIYEIAHHAIYERDTKNHAKNERQASEACYL